MATIVFFCIPAHGHTNPTLNVVRELVTRGNRVVYYSYDEFREKIEDAGAEFVSCNGFDAQLCLTREEGAKIGSDLALSTRVLVDTTLALDEPVCREMERLRPDCIVADSMAVWGKAVAKKLGIPYVCSTTTFAFNRESAKIMPHSLKETLSMITSMGKVNAQVKRLKQRGYPVKSILDLIGSDQLVEDKRFHLIDLSCFEQTVQLLEKYADIHMTALLCCRLAGVFLIVPVYSMHREKARRK